MEGGTVTGTAVAKRDDAVKATMALVDKPEFQEQLKQALPPSVSVERFTRTAKLAVDLHEPGSVRVRRADPRRSPGRAREGEGARQGEDRVLADGRRHAVHRREPRLLARGALRLRERRVPVGARVC